jgi:hypothetical protein
MSADTGPWRLIAELRAWAERVAWCEWLELSGSLGRGAGDEMSDVDAGLGVADTVPFEEARDQTAAAVRDFAPVADSIIQPYGEGIDHVIVQYADGRQLSLVVFPASRRKGLPPGARPLLDRTGVLNEPWTPDVFAASLGQQREWAFLAWWGLGDVAKHTCRGNCWRALRSLDEVRELTWRLYAASVGVDYPGFGAVSVENAGLPAPAGLESTLPGTAEPEPILAAARALARVLEPLSAPHAVGGLKAITQGRLDYVGDDRSRGSLT